MVDKYTYHSLGTNGRFGNQMFQYAALFSIAKDNGCELVIPDSVVREDFPLSGAYEILEAFPDLSAIKSPSKDLSKGVGQQYREPGFSYDQNFHLIRPNVDIHGYFQSEMYFKHHRADLLKEFTFSPDVITAAQEKINDFRTFSGCENLCAIHIRRGDYKNHPDYHTNLSGEYYNAAMQHMVTAFPDVHAVVFSDDIEWCKLNLPNSMDYSDASSQFEDMCMMSLCDLHIIANSSFSWWGSWLSNSKRTIAPKAWFGPRGPDSWSSIYREGWYVV